MRERILVAIDLPMPAPLPSLRDALARRGAIFEPFDGDPAPVAPRGLLARCAAGLRGLAEMLEPTKPRGLREAGGAPGLKRS